MVVSPSGKVTFDNNEHPANADAGNVLHPEPIVTVVSFLLFPKQLSPIEVTLLGTVIVFSPLS